DDMSFRLLAMLHDHPPPGMSGANHRALAGRIRESLGDPAFYRTSVDKTALPPAAVALGVPFPPFVIAASLAEAERFAAAHGFPVVVKRSHSTGGAGVAICDDARQLRQAFATLLASAATPLGDTAGQELLVQKHIHGRVRFYPCSAWKGELLAG